MDIATIKAMHAEHGKDLALVVNMSGGKDSVRMLAFLREHFSDITTYVVYADTGFEHVRPISAEEFARQRTADFGLELVTVRNPNKTYLEMVERRGKFPSSSTRQCTSDLKRDPIHKFIRTLAHSVIINCTGIRAAESASRSKQNPWKQDARISKAGRQVWNWMPIFHESLQQVLDWHQASGTALHPVYSYAGGYLKRLSCRVCIFATNADIKAIYQHDREAFDLVASLEQRIGFTMRAGESLFQIIGQDIAADSQAEEFEAPCAA